MIIQQAGPESIPQIQQLVQTIWPATYDPILPEGQSAFMLQLIYSTEALLMQMQQGQQFIVVQENEQPLGFAAFSPKDGSADISKLHKIYILPNQQGKGIGSLLINYVIKAMAPARRLQLNVNRQNPARYFYEKLGFEVIESVDIPIGNNFFMEDYIMQRTV